MTLVNERARTYDTIQSAIKLSTSGGLDVYTKNATVPCVGVQRSWEIFNLVGKDLGNFPSCLNVASPEDGDQVEHNERPFNLSASFFG